MGILKFDTVLLLIWAAWYLCWTVIFAGVDVATGHALLSVTVGAIVALLVTGRLLEREKRKRNK